MNKKDEIVEKMIDAVEKIEKEAIVEKYSNDNAMKKDAVSKIYKKLLEETANEN